MKCITFRKAIPIAALVYLSLISTSSANPPLDFQPLDQNLGDHFRIDTRCNRPADGPDIGCGGAYSHIDTTPFLQELVLDPESGEYYYHVIVGLPGEGFAQETYIKASGPTWEGGLGSASLGDGNCRWMSRGYSTAECNLGDPLGETHDNTFTGNGSGDPNTVLMRQVMGGTWDETTNTWSCGTGDGYCLEFLKDEYITKPAMSQTVNDPASGMTSYFEFDMSNSDYNTDTVAGNFTNMISFDDPGIQDIAAFNYATDADPVGSTLTGGRYIFTGTGPTDATLEPYQYVDDTFKLDRDWTLYKQQQ